jgi:cytochrome b561
VDRSRIANRYHTALVVLHWLSAVLILAMLAVGFLVLERMSNADPAKVVVLGLHMGLGIFIVALMVLRFVVRESTARPARADSGHPVIDVIGSIAHYVNYAAVILTALAGLTLALSAGLIGIVFQRSGEPLPPDFESYPALGVHALMAAILTFLIAIHIAAALWHQFIVRSHIFRRLGLGPRVVGAVDATAGPVPRGPRG